MKVLGSSLEVEFPTFRTYGLILGHVRSRTRQGQINDLVSSTDIDFLVVLATDAKGVHIPFAGCGHLRPRHSDVEVRWQSVAVRRR